MNDPIRVLVVDDSVVIRRLLTMIISEDPDLEVAGVAPDGRVALSRIDQLEPDIVTLDVEMPELDGIGTLRELRTSHPRLPVVMFSTVTERGAAATLDALSLGAADYVTKPANVGSVGAAVESVRSELIPKIKALVPRRAPAPVRPRPERPPTVRSVATADRFDVVAIGASTGGPNALAAVLASLPRSFPVPIVVVQHMPPVFTNLLAQRLDQSCAIGVHEGAAGAVIEPGHAYIAPGDHHLVLRRRALGAVLAVNQDPPEHFCRPAVDVLFRSVAATYGGNVLGVVLTGMGSDGRAGCETLRPLGAHIVVQDEPSSVVWGMPGAVASAGLADEILPLTEIGPSIVAKVAAGSAGRTVGSVARRAGPVAPAMIRGSV